MALNDESFTAVAVTDDEIEKQFRTDIKEAVNEALWGNQHPLNRAIQRWQHNLSILPENTREKLLKKIRKDMGI